MSEILSAIAHWKPNRWLMAIGALLMMASIISGMAGFEVVDEMRISAFWGGMMVLGMGALFAWKAAELESRAEDRRRRGRPKPDPTSGNAAFLEWFKDLPRPITRTNLAALRFPYDQSRKPTEVEQSLLIQRADWWALRGDIVLVGDTYDLREDITERTVLQ